MIAYLIEWLSLLGRWAHFVVGIAWIGASFYFIWLDNHLDTPKNRDDEQKGVGGEIWSVHGGGFYHAQKYRLAPPALPETLHWFKWEAYTTWLTGMFLLALIYWYGAEVYLIDRSLLDVSRPAAVGIGAGVIIAGWLIYDWLCRSALLAGNDRVLGVTLTVLTVIAAYGLCQIFSGRGAYMHFGALLGTIMVANVFFVIIPGQRALVAATEQGTTPDPAYAIRAKQRSVHNTYFTLPVLFVMISNHYAMTYSHSANWLILIAISLAGALIRVYFVARHQGSPSVATLIVAAVLLAGVAALIAPRNATTATGTAPVVSFGQVQSIVQARCVSCHADNPTHLAFVSAPGGVVLDSAARIVAEADRIYQQAVVLRAMPIGNLTAITEAERAAIAHWYTAGATR